MEQRGEQARVANGLSQILHKRRILCKGRRYQGAESQALQEHLSDMQLALTHRISSNLWDAADTLGVHSTSSSSLGRHSLVKNDSSGL